MLVYSSRITPRLLYICDFIGRQLTGNPIFVTDNEEEYRRSNKAKINYGERVICEDELHLFPHPILFETDIKKQETDCFEIHANKAFFKTGGDYPFDIFAASFYLLSRYEEYLPHPKDLYGRFAHESSLAFKERFIQVPLVNIWLGHFREWLQQRFHSLEMIEQHFEFVPTYDIDEAWSFRNKDRWRSLGASVKDICRGDLKRVQFRNKVRAGKLPDPFDSYEWIDELNRSFQLKPIYFFLVADKTGRYDRNILPSEIQFAELIKQHAANYTLGVHPSWQSGDHPPLIKYEIHTLERCSEKRIQLSRQHFIRFTLPETFRHLIDAGITDDYSMGYGTINGFRASVASPFYWYDLFREEQTGLLLHPFCYMEANSFYEERHSPMEALHEMHRLYHEVKKVKGRFITIWHNTFLGTASRFSGWREIYAGFVREIMRND